MGHHGRADDSGGEQHALGAAEARHQQVAGHVAGVRAGVDDLEHEGDEHHSGEHRDPGLEPPEAHLLQGQDREGAGAGDQPGGEQRDAEQQV